MSCYRLRARRHDMYTTHISVVINWRGWLRTWYSILTLITEFFLLHWPLLTDSELSANINTHVCTASMHGHYADSVKYKCSGNACSFYLVPLFTSGIAGITDSLAAWEVGQSLASSLLFSPIYWNERLQSESVKKMKQTWITALPVAWLATTRICINHPTNILGPRPYWRCSTSQ